LCLALLFGLISRSTHIWISLASTADLVFTSWVWFQCRCFGITFLVFRLLKWHSLKLHSIQISELLRLVVIYITFINGLFVNEPITIQNMDHFRLDDLIL
jgi:hypothetical protein